MTARGHPGGGPRRGRGRTGSLDAPASRTVPLADDGWRSVMDLATRDRLTPLLATAVAEGALPVTLLPAGERRSRRTSRRCDSACSWNGRCSRLPPTLRAGPDHVSGVEGSGRRAPRLSRIRRSARSVTWTSSSSRRRTTTHCGVLRASGAQRRFTEVRPGFDRRWGKGACLVAPGRHPDRRAPDVCRRARSG